jgi:zinc transport system permease protein
VLVSKSDAGSVNVVPYLFGSILTVDASEVRVIAALGLAIVITMAFIGRGLLAVVLDEESARVAGLPVDALNATLSVLTAVTVVAAMRVVGVLLIAALMVLPVATSRLLSGSFRATVGWSVAIGLGSVVAGLAAARQWGLAPGGSIVLVAALLFAVVAVVGAGARGATLPWTGQQTARTDGYGFTAAPPPGWISKCVCVAVYCASPVLPTYPITSPWATWRGPPSYPSRWK